MGHGREATREYQIPDLKKAPQSQISNQTRRRPFAWERAPTSRSTSERRRPARPRESRTSTKRPPCVMIAIRSRDTSNRVICLVLTVPLSHIDDGDWATPTTCLSAFRSSASAVHP
jgi:hypothetical protein